MSMPVDLRATELVEINGTSATNTMESRSTQHQPIQPQSIEPQRIQPQRNQPQPKQQERSTCFGRVWTHPIQVPMVIGTFVGTGYSVFKFVDMDYPTAGVSLGLGVVTLCACLGFTVLVPKKRFEENVEAVGDRVKDLTQENLTLKENVQKLEKIRDDLLKVQKEAEESINTMRDLLDKKSADINKFSERVKVVEGLYELLKNDTLSLAESAKKFNEQNKVLKGNVDEIAIHIEDLDKNEDEISEELDQFDDANAYMKREKEQLATILSAFSADMSLLQDGYLKIRAAIEELKPLIGKVDEADDKFRDGANSLNNTAGKLIDMTKELKILLEDISEASESSQRKTESH